MEKQKRKQYEKRGECSSKMVSFRADRQTLEILETVANKGRLLNELVQSWWRKPPAATYDPDEPPEENNIPMSDEL